MEVTEQILQAATEVFARSGYKGARMAEIALKAGVNKATIYYHIGGKDDLYREVLHQVLDRTAAYLDQVFAQNLSPLEKIQAYVDTINRMMAENPYIPPIVIRELVTGGEHMPQDVVVDLLKIVGRLRGVIEEGVKEGHLYAIHPFVVHIIVAGTLALYRMAGPLVSRLTQIPELPTTEEISNLMKELVSRALTRR